MIVAQLRGVEFGIGRDGYPTIFAEALSFQPGVVVAATALGDIARGLGMTHDAYVNTIKPSFRQRLAELELPQ